MDSEEDSDSSCGSYDYESSYSPLASASSEYEDIYSESSGESEALQEGSTTDEDSSSDDSDAGSDFYPNSSRLCDAACAAFSLSITERDVCKKGLQLMNRLFVSGNREPALMIRDFLNMMDAWQGAAAMVIAKIMGLHSAFDLLLGVTFHYKDKTAFDFTLPPYNPVHHAVQQNNVELTRILLKTRKARQKRKKRPCGALFGWLNNLNKEKMSPLAIAAHEGYSECLSSLLKAGARVNLRCKDGTALHYSARGGHASCLNILLKCAGVKKNAHNDFRYTPLMMAVEYERFECVSMLLDAGVEVKRKSKAALHRAVLTNNVKILKMLLNAGAPLEFKYESLTPLCAAACIHSLECLQFLIEAGADVNVKLPCGTTPLNMVVEYGYMRRDLFPWLKFYEFGLIFFIEEGKTKTKQEECLRVLLEAGLEANSTGNCPTPLYNSACRGLTGCMSILLSFGADVNILNGNNATPLHGAVEFGGLEAMKILLNAGVNMEQKNYWGLTALHIAVASLHLDHIQLLIEAGANVNALNDENQSPLEYLASLNSVQYYLSSSPERKDKVRLCVNSLIDAGADVLNVDSLFLFLYKL